MRKRTKLGGFILLLTLIMTAVFAAIAGGAFLILTSDYRSLAFRSAEVKAYWISEAGMAYATRQLKNNLIVWSGNNATVGPSSLGGGTFQATLTKSAGEVAIVTTGTYNNINRKTKAIQTLVFPDAFSYAIFGSNSNDRTLSIGSSNSDQVVIDGGGTPGGLFYKGSAYNDAVQVRNAADVVNGYVYADQITGGGTYTSAPSDPNPIPTYPAFDVTSYNSGIAVADSAPRSNLTLSGSSNLNLSGQTLYYDAVTIQNSATITGPGTIVSRKAFMLKNSAQIGADVNVISKTSVTLQDTSIVAAGGSFYARKGIVLGDSTNVSSTLIADADNVHIKNTAEFTGISFSDSLTVNGVVDIKGSLVTNSFGSNQISGDARVTFGKDYLPGSVATGFQGGYVQKADSWIECSTDSGVSC